MLGCLGGSRVKPSAQGGGDSRSVGVYTPQWMEFDQWILLPSNDSAHKYAMEQTCLAPHPKIYKHKNNMELTFI